MARKMSWIIASILAILLTSHVKAEELPIAISLDTVAEGDWSSSTQTKWNAVESFHESNNRVFFTSITCDFLDKSQYSKSCNLMALDIKLDSDPKTERHDCSFNVSSYSSNFKLQSLNYAKHVLVSYKDAVLLEKDLEAQDIVKVISVDMVSCNSSESTFYNISSYALFPQDDNKYQVIGFREENSTHVYNYTGSLNYTKPFELQHKFEFSHVFTIEKNSPDRGYYVVHLDDYNGIDYTITTIAANGKRLRSYSYPLDGEPMDWTYATHGVYNKDLVMWWQKANSSVYHYLQLEETLSSAEVKHRNFQIDQKYRVLSIYPLEGKHLVWSVLKDSKSWLRNFYIFKVDLEGKIVKTYQYNYVKSKLKSDSLVMFSEIYEASYGSKDQFCFFDCYSSIFEAKEHRWDLKCISKSTLDE